MKRIKDSHQKLTCSAICSASKDHTTLPEVHLSSTQSTETTPHASRRVCLPLINTLEAVVENVFFSFPFLPELLYAPLSHTSPQRWGAGNHATPSSSGGHLLTGYTTRGHCFCLDSQRALCREDSSSQKPADFSQINTRISFISVFITFSLLFTLTFQNFTKEGQYAEMGPLKKAQCMSFSLEYCHSNTFLLCCKGRVWRGTRNNSEELIIFSV